MKSVFQLSYYYSYCLISIKILLILICTQGCKKEWLEAKADKKQAVPSTVREFQAMLDNEEYNRSLTTLGEIASDGYHISESMYNSLAAHGYLQNAYLRYPVNTLESQERFYINGYYNLYNYILDMNIILSESEKYKANDQVDFEQVRAQALFNRGRFFFDLAQVFAAPFNDLTSYTSLGIALRLSTDITAPSKRSTIQETYDRILLDLTTAKDMLPVRPKFLTRASKPAALGMLARVYLTMGDYKNAFKCADEYLSLKNQLLDYTTINVASSYIGINTEVAFLDFLTQYSILTSGHLIDVKLYDDFDDNDLRKQVFFKKAADGIVFKGFYSNSEFDFFAGIATDEIYLIRSECYARSGDLTAAMKDLNDLLRTRWAKGPDGLTTYIDQTALTEMDALIKIFAERKKQLILRGIRWSDLRRLNQDDRFKVTLTRDMGGETYSLPPNSERYTFPFPIQVIQRSNMPQNPGW